MLFQSFLLRSPAPSSNASIKEEDLGDESDTKSEISSVKSEIKNEPVKSEPDEMSPRAESPEASETTETPKPEFLDDDDDGDLRIDEDQSDISNESDNDEGIKLMFEK